MKKSKTTWSEPTKEWQGFAPAAYSLDFEKVWNLPISRVTITDGRREEHPSTLGDVFVELKDQTVTDIQRLLTSRVITASGEQSFVAPSFNLDLLATLLRFHLEGIEGFASSWFWYDSDSVTDDPHDSYSFFVVYQNKIVSERVPFSDNRTSGFDPSAFKTEEDERRIWIRDYYWEEAVKRFWYRKFYSETRTGQLMLLRPDNPPLFHFPEGRWSSQAGFAAVVRELATIRQLVLFLLIAVAILVLKVVF